MKLVVIQVDEPALDTILDVLKPYEEVDVSVVGVFKLPTKFCDPSDGHRGKKTDAGWSRGKKYGWWVCGVCKKPTRAWATNLNALLSSARNLLVENQILGAAPIASIAQSESTTNTSQGTENPTASSVASTSQAEGATSSDTGGLSQVPSTTSSNPTMETTTTGQIS